MAYRQNNDVFGKDTDLVGTKGPEINLTKCIEYRLPLSARTRPEEDGHHQQQATTTDSKIDDDILLEFDGRTL